MRPAVLDRHKTNLVTNPKAATDTTGWTNASLVTFERVTSLPTTTGLPENVTTGFHAVGNATQDHGRCSFAVVSGDRYRFSAYIYVVTLPATNIILRVADSGQALEAQTNTTTTGSWVRLSANVLADETATWTLRVLQNGAGAAEYYWTAALVERNSGPSPYFEGTPGIHINSF